MGNRIVFTAPLVETRSEGRLVHFSVTRELDAARQPTGRVTVAAQAQMGETVDGAFVERSTVDYFEVLTGAQAAAGIGDELATIQTKVLQRMQTKGLLPAGPIT